MLVKQTIYALCILLFLSSILILIYSLINKKRNISKYIIVLSITYIIYSILCTEVFSIIFNISVGLEILLLRLIELITIVLFIISIVISKNKLKDSKIINQKFEIEKLLLILLISLPIILISISFFRETYFINNSKLVIIYGEGENLNINYFGYAVNDNYSKEISIGTYYKGSNMNKYLPKGFNKLNFNWSTDKVEINNNKITIYKDKVKVYEGKIDNNISTNEIKEVYYK